MSAVIIVHADGVFCDSTHEVPNVEPDANALRWFHNMTDASQEQVIVTCESPNSTVVDIWLRTFDLRYSYVLSLKETNERQQVLEIMRHLGAQQSKAVLYIGQRFNICNLIADFGVPVLRYLPPTGREQWEVDPRESWGMVVARQGGEK
jgi:hypothetical protein